MHAIHWLGEDTCHRDEVVGGKAASLSRLMAVHRVPHGFAIPALPAMQESMPQVLVPIIAQAYAALGARCGTSEPAVAVRSSALDEDGAEASFAGQHDTYLNIRGEGALLDAVLRCARSAASHEAMAYRAQRGLPLDDLRIGVLVQQLVPSDVSAVVFSANPVSGSRDEVMITSSWGLGESIVGGTVTPDTYVVSKAGLDVSWRDIALKDRMTVMTELGTEEAPVPDHLREAPSLADAQVREIAQLAVMLEDAVGHPVDVECAIAEETLYLLQCRPITTLG